jgi:glycosyltransferase involved in cell wall biosynthesis
MFDFFIVLKQHNEQSKFLIVTIDSENEIINKARLKNIHSDCLIVRKAKRSEMPLIISISDFTILFIKQSFSKQGSSPTKLAEALVMGVPAVANSGVGDNEWFFKEKKIGILIDKLEPQNYHQAVKRIIEFKKESSEIREFAITNLSLEMGVNLYADAYRSIL